MKSIATTAITTAIADCHFIVVEQPPAMFCRKGGHAHRSRRVMVLRITNPRLLTQRMVLEKVSAQREAFISHHVIIAKMPKKKLRRMASSYYVTNSAKVI